MVTVGYLKGGEAGNVIPESVNFGGTFRSLTMEGLGHIQERIKEVKLLKFYNAPVYEILCFSGWLDLVYLIKNIPI